MALAVCGFNLLSPKTVRLAIEHVRQNRDLVGVLRRLSMFFM